MAEGFDLRRAAHPAGGGGCDLHQAMQRPASSSDHPMARHSPAKPRYSKKAQAVIGRRMEDFAAGQMRTGVGGQKGRRGAVVTKPAQAKAIALSEARSKGLKVPKQQKKR